MAAKSFTFDDFLSGVKRWALAAVAACTAEAATFPIDFTKTRLQLQNELGKNLAGEAAVVRLGLVQTFVNIVKHEGLLAMYSGLPAAALRQAVYGGINFGMYTPVRTLIIGADVDPKDAPLYKRLAAGAITGGVGQAIASPTDVVKVRLQADGRLKALGKEPRYKGTLDAFRRIGAEEGMRGYFRGLGPSVARAAVQNASGIATYDHAKHLVRRMLGTNEGLGAQVAAAFTAGLVSASVSTPFDVIKTRIMNQTAGATLYKGPIDCAVKTVRAEGFLALYKSWLTVYMRLGPWQMVFYLTFEQVNKLASVKAM